MAYPIILVNSSTGSDSTASGAGPSTSISGSTGRTRNTASQLQFGLFGATDDLSGVATDGSAVLYMANSTAGQRNFSSIAGTRNTRDTTTGDMTSGSAVLSALGSTTGWVVGEVIKVTGAGAAAVDLYSTILTVDSGTQVTLNNTASTTVTGNAVENPKQFTLATSQGVNTALNDTAWAVGGKRATLSGTNSRKLGENNGAAGDALPGWRVRMESGFTDTFSAVWNLRRSGTLTEGPVIFEGDPAAGTMPILTFSNNGNAIVLIGTMLVVQHFELRNTNATKTASAAIAIAGDGMRTIRNIKAAHQTNYFWRGFGGLNGMIIQDCEVAYTANLGVDLIAGYVEVINCRIHHVGTHGIVLSGSAVLGSLVIDTIINDCVGNGIHCTKNNTGSVLGGVTLIHVTVDACDGHGIEFTAGSASIAGNRLTMLNCNITNNTGIGLNYSGSGITAAEGVGIVLRGNNFYGNGSVCNVAGIVREEEQTLDPQYVDSANGNYGVGPNLKAKAYPVGGVTPVGQSLTYSYKDIGAAQRREYASNPMVNSGF